jgi:hypothetical protein
MPMRTALMSCLFLSLVACGTPASDDDSGAEQEASFLDGTYSCEASNTTSGNGPYSLECDKSGDEVVIHFNNGGHITLDVDSQEMRGEQWHVEGTNAQRGEAWEVILSR